VTTPQKMVQSASFMRSRVLSLVEAYSLRTRHSHVG
jgi:hypothetical protein